MSRHLVAVHAIAVTLLLGLVVETGNGQGSPDQRRRAGSDTAFIVGIPDLIPENIAYDSRDRSFLIGSLAQRRIVHVVPGRDPQTLTETSPELGAILGMKVETRSHTLWANTAYARDPVTKKRARSGSALLEIDLITGVVRHAYAPPDTSSAHLFNDLVIASSGDVYLTDSEAGAVYVLRHGGKSLKLLARGPRDTFGYPNGIALAPDGRSILVSHATGITMIDARSGRMQSLSLPRDSALGGIDGLYISGWSMIAIQGTDSGEQVITARIRQRSGTVPTLDCIRIVERGHPAFEQPTTGVVVADTLFYIANSQVRRLDPFDRVAPSRKSRATVILRQLIPRDDCRSGTSLPGLTARAPSSADSIRSRIRDWRIANDIGVLTELTTLLGIPNASSDSANLRRNATHLADMLRRRGIEARLLESPTGTPAVFGDLRVPGATTTIVFYAHYDGQPVDTAEWLTPPWHPVVRNGLLGIPLEIPRTAGGVDGEWRVYARSASDDKSPIVAMLAAIDALRASHIPLSVNLKIFLDGEEEAGSVSLPYLLSKNADLLRADLWVIGDGPVHQSRRPQVVFGVRGFAGVNLTVFGPVRGLHSGHYGNWIYNPVTLAANLVASMRDDDGRITIPGFYDDVLPATPAERVALRSVPEADSALRYELQVGATEATGTLMERVMLPALNVRGIQGGSVGDKASNTIPTHAQASIDFRLVPNQSPERIERLVRQHMESRGYHVMDRDPDAAERRRYAKIVKAEWGPGYPATRTPMNLPVARAVVRAAEAAVGAPIIQIPTLGGSLPMYIFSQALKVPLVVLPIVNHDNNQHTSNENLRLQNLWDGIELYGGILATLGFELRAAQ